MPKMRNSGPANHQFLAVIMSASDDHLSNYPGCYKGQRGKGGRHRAPVISIAMMQNTKA